MLPLISKAIIWPSKHGKEERRKELSAEATTKNVVEVTEVEIEAMIDPEERTTEKSVEDKEEEDVREEMIEIYVR